MKPELLSPAGSIEAIRAAIAAGADALYLGSSSHGARATAGFDDERLQEAIHLAHLYGLRVYVTVNTLIKQQELNDVRQLLKRLIMLRADAVIVQDLGLVRLIKTEFPELCVHASTQMSIHNSNGARFLLDLGVSRVVLARECDIEDINAVAQTGIETEVFVHGAMCVSVSGQCLMSSQIGGRSGNRGKCAQPCRLQYSFKDHSGALLSMHDLNTLAHIPALQKAGARSFKIEGRLKRPEYVYLVTKMYRKALDLAEQGLTFHNVQADVHMLAQVFSRGFTAGHAFSNQDSKLIGTLRVSHLGSQIGQVIKVQPRGGFVLADVHLTQTVNNGDGLQIRGIDEQDCIYSGPVTLKGQIATLRLRTPPTMGDSVWRLQDEAQLMSARAEYEHLPKLFFDAVLKLSPGNPAQLTVTHQDVSVTLAGEIAQPAQKQPLDKESTRRLIAKTGSTPFELKDYTFVSDAPAFMPASAINALRRAVLSQLEERIVLSHQLPKAALPRMQLHSVRSRFLGSKPHLYTVVPANADRAAFIAAGLDHLIFYPTNYREGQLANPSLQVHQDDYLLLPPQIKDADLSMAQGFIKNKGCKLAANNIGQLLDCQAELSFEGIPVWNESTLLLLQAMGVKAAVLSRELSEEDVKALPHDILELILPVYGFAQVMQLSHCPARVALGLISNKAECRMCERGNGVLGEHMVDRFGCRYPLLPTHFNHGCLISMHFHKALHLAENAPRSLNWLIDLRLETPENALNIARYYAKLLRGERPNPLFPVESGRYFLGVE
ncbi:MAG: U32 family peptidase [Clostridiales bacterium]|nr:U32 family peptidase [Clostridiales bacterium]